MSKVCVSRSIRVVHRRLRTRVVRQRRIVIAVQGTVVYEFSTRISSVSETVKGRGVVVDVTTNFVTS